MSFGSSGDSVDDRDLLRHELIDSLASISANTQLLRRRVLRADGLSNLERDQMLGTIASTMAAVARLTAQLESVLPMPGTGEPAGDVSS
jgi:hypothetical protein